MKDNNCTVAHVVSSVKFALKAEECGVDAIVAEGFEAGGHNGREETTTMTLIPLIKKSINNINVFFIIKMLIYLLSLVFL